MDSIFSADCWAGYDLILTDATVVSRPGSNGTTARVHHALRLTTLQSVQMDVTDVTGGETFRRLVQMGQPGRVKEWAASVHPGSEAAPIRGRLGVNGFQVLPRRWVVERTFGWLGIAMIGRMARRLVRG